MLCDIAAPHRWQVRSGAAANVVDGLEVRSSPELFGDPNPPSAAAQSNTTAGSVK